MSKLFLLLIFVTVTGYGQQDSLSAKRFRLTPLPVIYYSPETRLGFGALLAANFETVKIPDSITRSSYAQTYFLYTINKQYDWGTLVRLYTPGNKYIVQGKFNYTFFPEYYYGIATEEPESGKDTIQYNRVGVDLRFYRQWKKHFFAGIATRYNKITNVEAGQGHFIEDKPTGYNDYWVLGFAPAFTIETRDNYVYPRKGFYLEALYYIHPSWSGKSYSFRSFKLDIRQYYPLKLISSIDAVAFQLLANLNTGNVPFKDMADIGGSYTMRGYYTGFYRYKNLYAFQAEYRTMIWWRLGLAVWAGAALTPEKWYTLSDHSVKPNAGIGLRIMMNRKDRLNVRVDQGFGKKDQRGFYLDIAEAY
ncbi:MAG TPA: BamA/TamA family outer membrane protein [Ohtaekwangia sp.]|uniref:BamA/TamA family outer membrane protein n=1 Tax=Ohtaekwangia sp. TaxID=2066019 RepID=UPI002F938AF6